MKHASLAFAAALLGATIPFPLAAQEAPPPVSSVSNEEAIKAELGALVEKVKARLGAGAETAQDLAEELKAFDALSAKYAGEKSDAAAMIGMMKAGLYIQVLGDSASGLEQLRRLAKDFADTEVGRQLPAMIADLEKVAAAEALTAVGKEFATFSEKATDGSTVDLAAYRGKVVLIDFWATWCGPCVDELPNVLAAYEKHHADGFEVIGISLDKDGAALAAFTEKNKMAWPQIFDGQGWKAKLAQAYGIRSIPATFLLDREGRIIAKGLRGEALSSKVAEALASGR